MLKLESALAKLRTPQKVEVPHDSPIQATVQGEPPEIVPFLGSSRLETLDRYPRHRRIPWSRAPRQQEGFPDQPPYKLLEIPIGVESPVA